ncbi:MAG: hypothetical protein MR932_03090 [Treponema porcinum]|uniref:hypothetical protein n=1 Tax=uncultured Treponema sp. TaxID=162155 RepID=UPI0025917E07|nr:hypothetical protein [uncultured Treponema sp.]MCI7114947.1 hypothetical protein [Treponema porcinum]
MNGAVRKMNLKGYKVFSLLFAAFCVLLCASGCSLQKKKNVLQDDDGTAVGIANPVVQSDPEEILEVLGIRFNEPEGASEVRYSIIGGKTAQMDFVWNGVECTARISGEPSFTDISGMYFSWKSEISTKIERCDAVVKLAESGGSTTGVCMWYDTVPGLMCSVSMKNDATQELLEAIARQVYTIVYV